MAQPRISIGNAAFSVILGSVCAFGWYTEKYRRDEDEIDGQIRKLYLRTAQDSESKMPQMTATIKGQSMDLDGRMDKLVWGGKAQLENNNSNSNSNNNPSNFATADGQSDDSNGATRTPSNEEKKTRKKRKKRKQKKEKTPTSDEEKQRTEELERQEQEQRKLVLRSSIAGVAVGAVAVAAVSALLGGGSRKN